MSAISKLQTFNSSIDEVFRTGGRNVKPYVIKQDNKKDDFSVDLNLSTFTSLPRNKSPVRILARPEYVRKLPSLARQFKLLQQWEGNVKRISDTFFVAVITDKTNPKNSSEEVEIDLDDISEDDRELVKSGACFYWSVGFEEAPGISRQRVSRIRFRRIPGWSTRELERAKIAANLFSDLF